MFFLIQLIGCQNHKHDGLWLKNYKRTFTSGYAWVIDGEKKYIYSGEGNSEVKKIEQFDNRIELPGGEIYFLNNSGEFIVNPGLLEYKMIKYSDRTDYSRSEIKDIIEKAYEK